MERKAIFVFQGNPAAMRSLVREADSGDAEAQMWLGTYYYSNMEYQKAFSLFKKSSEQENYQAAFNLARMYDKGHGVKKDLVIAKDLYLLLASKGYADAQHNIGVMYLLGEGVGENYQEALKWLKLAASQGQIFALRDLGSMYADGKGVTKNLVLAYVYMSLAALSNIPKADETVNYIRSAMTYSQLDKAKKMLRKAAGSSNKYTK